MVITASDFQLHGSNSYPPGDCRLAALNRVTDPNGACTNAVKDGSGCIGGDHHRR